MSLFTFYREDSPEPPSLALAVVKEDGREPDVDKYANIDFHRYPSGCNLATFFGTPRLRPTTGDPDGLDFSDELSIDGLDMEKDAVAYDLEYKGMRGQMSTMNSHHRVSEAPTLCPSVGPMSIPVELWEIIFSLVCPGADDESYPKLNDLLSCALTCRVWSLIALPMLYRTHGYGVLMPRPRARNSYTDYFPVAHCVDAVSGSATMRMLQLWRTLLLSCFTASRPTSPSRFTTFTGATLFPYITYVHHLDVRTLVMVLSGILEAQTSEDFESLALEADCREKFFAGALGAFEIAGEVRGERMIVDRPEYGVQSPVGSKDIKLFVGDTALMIVDFLYPHLHHLKSFAIPELGQLRVHSPITMSHPVGLITSFRSLTTLVISSGWMLCTGLGRAIAQIRPTIFDAQPNATDFSLVILDWRFKTYYNEPFHHHGDEASMEDFRHTLRSTAGFFNALNPNSITSLDVDFAVRYNRPRMPDLNDVAASIRHSRSMKALRLAHFRCTDETLLEVFKSMGRGGFQPKALALFEVCNDSEGSISRERWQFPCDIFDQLEHLELTRFSGMFDFAAGVVRRRSSSPPTSPSSQAAEDSVHTSSQPQQEEQSEQQPEQDHDVFIPRRLRTLKLIYTYKHLRESASEAFILFTIPRLSATLHTLKLVDTDHDLMSPIRPRRRTRYDAIYGHIESPLESLTNLHTLILTGDIAAFLLADRLPQIISALKSSLVVCDLCFPALPESLLQRFWELDKLQTLVLREWNWEDDDPRLRYFRMRQVAEKKLTVETVKKFWERCRVIKGPDGRVMLGLRELGIAGGFLEVAGGRSWGGLRRWGELRGGRFWWGAGEMPKVG